MADLLHSEEFVTNNKSIVVRSGQGDYTVQILEHLKATVEVILEKKPSVVVIDQKVAELYSDILAPILDSFPVLKVEATEEEKTLTGIHRILNYLQSRNCTRQSVLLAIGGGIIQDLTTFSSHVYYRGIRWMFVPTTLLSMADSCIGAKCGINFNQFKNQLGVFHSPSAVFISTKFLETLPEMEIKSGFGEILKLFLTGSSNFFRDLTEALDLEGFRSSRIGEFILGSLMVKKGIIEEDEYETDYRRILNYGHTFGHVLETLTDYEIPHGCAIAWGADLANWIAVRRGILSKDDFLSIHRVIERYFSFQLSRSISSKELLIGILHDKKICGHLINLVMLEIPGRLCIKPIEVDDILEKQVNEYLGQYNVVHWN